MRILDLLNKHEDTVLSVYFLFSFALVALMAMCPVILIVIAIVLVLF